jgi:hypothetical protein
MYLGGVQGADGYLVVIYQYYYSKVNSPDDMGTSIDIAQ